MKGLFDLDALYETKQGCSFKIVSTNGCNDNVIEFSDKFKTRLKVSNVQIKRGNISNPNHPVVFGVGYCGQGVHKSKENSKLTKDYNVWFKMIKRCYEGEDVAYENCTVCEEWLNFQNFAEWYKQQPNSSEPDFEIDKDILVKGNQIYCPDFCRIVPKEVNLLIKGRYRKRSDLPVGVIKHGCGYIAQATLKDINENESKCLGYFKTIDEAFAKYKEQKELYIKHVANKWKDSLSNDIYDSLMKLEVTQ